MEETGSEMSVQRRSDDALAQLVTLLRERLAQALGRAVQAQAMVSGQQIDAAIGSLAGVDVDLADAGVLHRCIILLRQYGHNSCASRILFRNRKIPRLRLASCEPADLVHDA